MSLRMIVVGKGKSNQKEGSVIVTAIALAAAFYLWSSAVDWWSESTGGPARYVEQQNH